MPTVIIPAHNEAVSIRETLRDLLPVLDDSVMQIIVVCNGCTDDTAALVKSFDPRIGVVEMSVGSKPDALNEGDRIAMNFPRIYMDADVQVNGADLLRLVDFMDRTGALAAAPTAKMDFSGSSWGVQAYYKVWFSLPYVQSGMVGCGAYVLSEVGRKRFDKFPDIISDDGFVRAHFTEEERPVFEDCTVVVSAPRVLSGLIKIKTRSRLGGRQLREQYPSLFNRGLTNPRWRTLLWYLFKPGLWPAMPWYLLVVGVSLWRSQRQCKKNQFSVWERDDTSRDQIRKRSLVVHQEDVDG